MEETRQVKLSDFEKRAEQRARHKALIMQILNKHPGLTHEQIRDKEYEWYGYTFTTDNRLRELRQDGWVESRKEKDGLLHWYPKFEEGCVKE
jgi:hypothetical protein